MTNSDSIINTFIKASVESASQPPMYLELFNKEHMSQFHTMIVAPFGLGKSSKVEEIKNAHLIMDYSFAGMVGTINKEGELVQSELLNARKKALLVDEAHRLGASCKKAMLSLLSNGKYSRSLGFKIKGMQKKIGTKQSGFMITPHKSQNGFDLYAQFSAIFFMEWIPKSLREAFLSRFITIIFEADIDDIYDFAYGKSILGNKFEDFDFKIHKIPCIVPENLHIEFINAHRLIIEPFKNQFTDLTGGYIVRNIINLIKLACHFARMDGRNKVMWKDFEKVIPLIQTTIKSTLLTKLTPKQYQILSFLKQDLTQTQIADEMGVSQPTINEQINLIKRKGLL